MAEPDFSITYAGPRAEWASLTGSPLWARSIEDVVAAWCARGWQHTFGERVPTPYGLGPEVHGFTLPEGRMVLWVPSYGDIQGQEPVGHETVERVFWILWQAGVRAMLVGGNHGVCDPRGEGGVQPGDVVLPWSFRTHRHHRGLRGTEWANPWPQANLFLDDPFCPELAVGLRDLFQPWVERGAARRVWTAAELRAALVQVETITFETEFDILQHLATNETVTRLQPDRPPVVTLHGDAINPVLARFLGIHVGYYSLVCNYAAGLCPPERIHDTMTTYYREVYPEMVLAVEAEALETLELPAAETCRCETSLQRNPDEFSRAMSGWQEWSQRGD
ncbi:hypothetical protein [Actomonas aquatica]|uniref:Nucleoside phosphorylase domain-containing protein n=1 Tax=Actomonas aquatica TaxID=2866162 RepID=A0ABZ1C932_9BACT|nr:hypothetical protein [Opitutus sp. WL0086]WRQ87976.1 hypothetical protein K1X11_001055 [Opitutus sp. WL0086]